jgi:Zn-dependent peptidase ImmA (M78 family)
VNQRKERRKVQKPLATNAEELDAFLGRFLRRYARVNAETCDRFTDAFAYYIQFTECPRNFREVAEHLGIRLDASLLQRAGMACWERVNGHYTIHYSRYADFQAASFSLAHELFEMLSAHPRFPTRLNERREEYLANRFAAQFLMPEKEVHAAAKPLLTPEMRRYLLPKLADRFQVSRPAMRFRLYDLGILLRPADAIMPRKQPQEVQHAAT